MGKGLGQMRGTVGWFRQTSRQLASSALAISELVKNSYDADASKVHLKLDHAFLPLDQKPWLEIRDDGHGMDIDDIRSRWSPIGDSKNREERLSPKGRVRQGGKGLGRLGAWRIGESVTIWTRKKGKRAIGLRYDLTGLDNGDPVESIKPVNVDADHVFKGDETGTVLRVGGFPERLTSPQNFCQKIHRELHLLPDPFSGLSDFEIQFTPPREVKKLQNLDLRELVEQSLYSADFIVTGGEVRGEFRNKNPFCPKSGNPVYISKRLKDMVPNAFTLSGVKIRIRAFNKNKIYGPVCFNVEGIGRVKQESFNEITGFRLYKDGIRVQPYGQQGLGRDWLGLDNQWGKRGDSTFKNDQIIASANYSSSENKTLREKASRDGLEDGPAKDTLFSLLKHLTMELRKFAGSIPRQKPASMQAPTLVYPTIRGPPGMDLREQRLEPINNGGDIEGITLDAPTTAFRSLRLDTATGRVLGRLPREIGTFTIPGEAENRYGKKEFTLMVQVIEPIPEASEPRTVQITAPSATKPVPRGADSTRPDSSTPIVHQADAPSMLGSRLFAVKMTSPHAIDDLKSILSDLESLVAKLQDERSQR